MLSLVALALVLALLTPLVSRPAGAAAAAATVDPIVGDWDVTYGAPAVVTMSGSPAGYTVTAKTPVRVTGSSCDLAVGTVIATFSGSGPTYSGQHGLWATSNCSFDKWTGLSLTLTGNTLAGVLSGGYGNVVFTKHATPSPGSAYSAAVKADHPLSYWQLQETTGSTAVDQQGATNGSITGSPSLGQPGPFAGSYAYGFHGACDGIDITAGQGRFSLQAFSLEMFVNAPKPAARGVMFRWHNYGYELDGNSDGTVSFTADISANQASVSVVSTTPVLDGNWHHIVVTDGGPAIAGAVRYPVGITLYVDGAAQAAASMALGSIFFGWDHWTTIARDIPSCAGNPPFVGALSQVAFYGTPLSSTQVATHFAAAVATTFKAVVLRSNGTSGYSADEFGKLTAFGGAPVTNSGVSWTSDVVRGLALVSDNSGYTLDLYGGLHPFGGAPDPGNQSGHYWAGWDIARSVAVIPGTNGGYVLDGYGGLHPFGGAPDPGNQSGHYWAGKDIARSVAVNSLGGGYVLDGYGGLHPFGPAPAPSSTFYVPGQDLARSVAINPAGTAGSVLDGYGGTWSFTAVPTATVTTLTSWQNPGHPDQPPVLTSPTNYGYSVPINYTATVVPVSPSTSTVTGTVSFSDNGSLIPGCASIGVGVLDHHAMCLVTYRTIGLHAITAAYTGDSNFTGSQRSLAETVLGTPVPNGLFNGYVIDPAPGGSGPVITAITATWQVPVVTTPGCNNQQPSISKSSTWIGLGGVYWSPLIQMGTSSDLEQDGCPSYWAWWELQGTQPGDTGGEKKFTSMTVSGGDTMSAAIQEVAPGKWNMTMYDLTTGNKGETDNVSWMPGNYADVIHEVVNGQPPLTPTTNVVFDNASFSTAAPGSPIIWQSFFNGALEGQIYDMYTTFAMPSTADADGDGFQVADGGIVPSPPSS